MAPMRPSASILSRIRKKLDQNGYREPMPPESVPLVQRLIDDLVSINKRFKETDASLKEVKEKCDGLSLSLEPYKEENGRLHSTLNALHMDNLRLQETNEKLLKDNDNYFSKLKNENQDLIFLVGELKKKIKEIEEESKRKSDRILQLQEKNLEAIIVTPGGTKKAVAAQRQRLDISSPLKEKMADNSHSCPTCGCSSESLRSRNKNIYMADLLKMTDRKIASLQEEIETHKEKLLKSDLDCAELRKKVLNRESEIDRLSHLLEGGRPLEAVVEDNQLRGLHSRLHQMELENDILVKTNSKLELKLKNVLGNTHEAMTMAMAMEDANQDLSAELKSAATTNKLLKKDCFTTAEVLSTKLKRNKVKLEDYKDDLVEQHSLYHVTLEERDMFKFEMGHLSHSNSCLKEDLAQLRQANVCLKEERQRLEQILTRSQGERKDMADKINTLTVKLQEQELEIHSNQNQLSGLRTKIATLEQSKSEVEASQNFFKKETEKLQEQKQQLEVEKAYFKAEMVKLESLRDTLEEEKSYYKDQAKELEEQKTSAEQARDYYNNDSQKSQEKISDLIQMEQKLKDKIHDMSDDKITTERERDHYSEQVVQLLDIMKVKPKSATAAAKSKLKPEDELPKVTYERDVLKQELKFYKTQLRSLQNQTSKAKGTGMDTSSGASVADGVTSRGRSSPFEREGDIDTEALKSERNFFHDQMNHFQQLYNETKLKLVQLRSSARSISPPSGDVSRGSLSPVDGSSAKDAPAEVRALLHELRVSDQEKEFFKEQYERLKTSLATPLSPSSQDDINVDALIREKNIYREERDFYQSQYEELSDKISQAAAAPLKSSGLKQELEKVLAEKRSMAMAKAQIEAQLKNLKDDYGELDKSHQDMISNRRELTKSIENLQNTALQKFPPSMQNFVGEIRKSRDSALEEVEKIKQDREATRTKLKNLTAQQIKDRSSAQEDYSAMQIMKTENEGTIVDLQQRLHSQTTLIGSLQNQIKGLQEALTQAQSDIGMTAEQSKQFKKLFEQKMGESDTQGHQLELRVSQLTATQTRVLELESQVAELQQNLARTEAEETVLRGNIGKIDNAKDALSTELDSKSEFILTIKNELKQRSAQIAGLEAQMTKMQARIDSLESSVEIEQRKLSEESQRCDRFQQDLAITSEQKDAANKEIRRLQKEVIGGQQNVKELRSELERTQSCRENFKRKAQEYCRTLEQINETMTNKDKEQEQFVKEFLSLNETLASLKDLNASLEESSVSQTQELSRMEEIIKTCKEERQEIIDQLNEMITRNENLEVKCKKLEEEKFSIEKNLLTSHDTNQKIELRKDEADNELKRLGVSVEKFMEDKRNLETRLEGVTAQLNSERNTVRSLEKTISENRNQEFVWDTKIKELEVQKSQLQRKISEITAEMESEMSESKRLRSKCSSFELDFERTKRQLTNEQYERERLEQELRRVRKYSDMSGAITALEKNADWPQRRSGVSPPNQRLDNGSSHRPVTSPDSHPSRMYSDESDKKTSPPDSHPNRLHSPEPQESDRDKTSPDSHPNRLHSRNQITLPERPSINNYSNREPPFKSYSEYVRKNSHDPPKSLDSHPHRGVRVVSPNEGLVDRVPKNLERTASDSLVTRRRTSEEDSRSRQRDASSSSESSSSLSSKHTQKTSKSSSLSQSNAVVSTSVQSREKSVAPQGRNGKSGILTQSSQETVTASPSYSINLEDFSSGSQAEASLRTEPFVLGSETQSQTSTRIHSSSRSVPPNLHSFVKGPPKSYYASLSLLSSEKQNGKPHKPPTTNGH